MEIKTFINRPIMSVMLSVIIVIIGIIGLLSLPIEQYPDIAPPAVKVSATYMGANAETIMKSVVTPLESSINGVENMQYMTSTAANNGTCTITIYFKQGSDPNMALVNVQNRVASAQGLLPAEVTKSGVTVRKTQNSNLKFITLYSPDGRYDSKFLTNYMKINIEPQLSRIPGVGEVNVFGADYALRIWLNPEKMHAYGLVPSDIDNALAAQNIESPTGSLGAESDHTYQYVLKYRGRYTSIEEFRNIVVKASTIGGETETANGDNCSVLRLGDVAIRHRKLVMSSLPFSILILAFLISITKTSLVPQEDMGTIDVNVQCKLGYSLAQTAKVMDQVEAAVSNIPQIKIHTRIDGRDAQSNQTSSAGFLSIRLKNWSERTRPEDDIDSVVNEIYRRTAFIKEADVNCATLPTIRGYGSASGFELYVQNRQGEDFRSLVDATKGMVDALNQRPEIAKAHYAFKMDYPQYLVEVDVARCMMKGVSPKDVLSALSAYVGGDYASNINQYTKLYRVMVQSEATYRLNEASLENMYVRSMSGSMSPLSEFVKPKKINGAEYLTHFNLFPAIRVNGTSSAGYSSGQAIQAISEVASQELPSGFGYELSGLSREESSQVNTTTLILGISMVFIYIILSCLYESLLMPFAILLVVPFGLCGSFLLTSVFGIDNSIYMQIGLVMLIGMLSKIAILLTEYATERRRLEGMSIVRATLSAASVRLRPIVMTASVMIIGMVLLMLAHGAGARGNIAIGTCVVGGMLLGTLAILLLLPVLYCVFEK